MMTAFRSGRLNPFKGSERSVDRRRLSQLYDRYRDATMISRETFVDNLELAELVARDPALANHAVVECGTWRGGMSAALIELLGERHYHFFDSFAGLPPAKEIDGPAAITWQEDKTSPGYYDNCTASRAEFEATIRRTGFDLAKLQIHEGFFEDTLFPAAVGPIALLRLDCDWYESTMHCLQVLFPKVAKNGVVIIDDYGYWDGCTRAVHDYLSNGQRCEAIRSHGASQVAYFRANSD